MISSPSPIYSNSVAHPTFTRPKTYSTIRIGCTATKIPIKTSCCTQPVKQTIPRHRPGSQARSSHIPHSAHASTALLTSDWAIWAALACAGAAGLQLERTKWGKEMSGALLSTLIGLALSNLGIVPSEATHIYSGVVNAYFLPLAVPLLLFAADLRRIVRDTGRLLIAFIAGAFATVLGSVAAWFLVPLGHLGADAWKVAAALTGRHIGGAVNYFQLSALLDMSPAVRMAGVAADDVIVAIYFIALYSLARKALSEKEEGQETSTITAEMQVDGGGTAVLQQKEDKKGFTVLDGATAVALSATLCALGTYIAQLLNYNGGSITVITGLTVMLATFAPKLVAPLTASGEALAAILMQLFFASVGASGNIGEVLKTAPTLFAWSAIAISVHLGCMVVWERLFKFSRKETCLASNANIGGPTTAAAMANAKGWKNSTVPALLIGIFGYATATFIGLAVGQLFKKLMAG